MSTTAPLDDQTDVDVVVLKRLRFVYKIVKALSIQPNTKVRQAHAYVLEVLDSIGDWSGNPNAEITELLDKQIFPLICRWISTFSKDEFNVFQQFFCKYLFYKWEETSNFIVLDFLAEIYGFIASIAPTSVAVELVQIFQQEEIPPHVSLVILPSLLKNVPDAVNNDVSDKGSRYFLLNMRNDVSPKHLELVLRFWNNLKNVINKTKIICQFAPILHQCIVTSFYLEFCEGIDILKVLQSLTEWSYSSSGPPNLEGFLLVSTIFLHSLCSTMLQNQHYDMFASVTVLMKRVANLTERCSNKRIRVFITRVLQRILEYAAEDSDDSDEVLKEFVNTNQMSEHLSNEHNNENSDLFDALESSLKQFSRGVKEAEFNDAERKRIMLMIDGLQKLVKNPD